MIVLSSAHVAPYPAMVCTIVSAGPPVRATLLSVLASPNTADLPSGRINTWFRGPTDVKLAVDFRVRSLASAAT